MVERVHIKIRLLRLKKNYSQEYMAYHLNISQSYYAKIENNKSDLTIAIFCKICKILDVDIVSFFSDFNVKE